MSKLNRNEPEPAATAAAARKPAAAVQELDVRGLSSPLPVLRAHRVLRGVEPGQVVKVLTSHAHTLAEFQSLVKHVPGYELLSQEESGGDYVHVLVRRR